MNTVGQTTQTQNNNNVPSLITTKTAIDFVPMMDKLTSLDQLQTDDINENEKILPSLAETVLYQTSINLNKKDVKFVEKEFSELTINEIYNNTLKTFISIINDISDLVSEKEILTNTEFRRKIVDTFLRKERRIYVGILLIILSFILYFIDSSA